MFNEKMNFKISTGLKNIIGKELITSEVVAVFELVKNSFDANAKNVIININVDEGQISIIDDGIGMSKDDIRNKWLFVAYSEKKDVQESNGRRYVGAKGIGRFACDRLGEEIQIITKTQEEKKYNVLNIKWGAFEKNSLEEFRDIPVNYSTVKDFKYIKASGTAIMINNLRDNWDIDRILKLKKSLEKLVNPFDYNIDMQIKLNVISKNPKLAELTSYIKNTLYDALKDKTMYIMAEFNDSINVTLEDRGTLIYNLKNPINDTGLDGIKICVYYLNTSAKNNFSRLMGMPAKDYGSIFIYKNNFRIYPYGEINYDTLGLDIRKTQGYNRYLGNREIIGYISISDPKNRFIEVSSRDRGFIENAYFKILEEIYMEYAHKPLEKYVHLVNWGGTGDTDITIDDIDEVTEKSLLPTFIKGKNYDVKINNDILKTKAPSLEKMLTKAINDTDLSNEEMKELFKKSKDVIQNSKKTIEEQAKNVNNQKQIISGLENQNNLLRNLNDQESIIQAEVTHHISKMSNELESCIKNIAELIDYNHDSKIMEELSRIRMILDKMRVFNQVILKGNFKAKGKMLINLFDYFKFYFSNSSYIAALSRNKKVSIHEGQNFNIDDWNYNVDVYEISVMIDNLIANAVELDANIIDISFEKKKIIVFSDTEHVLPENKEKIFELGFSTKIGGTGIGLYQIRNILNKYRWKIHSENTLEGVQFIIEVGN